VEILAAFNFSLANITSILLVALGLGLVIFIHELGHFAVAKWCGVKVERFSIGFGPVLWKVTRGETEYALSAIPFGGYVKMLGQDDADPGQMADEKIAKDPRSYTAKTVPQRIAIISAGVINNMVSAVLFFFVAFMLGVQYQPAVIGSVTPGMPAWKAGLRLGDLITRINNREDKELSFTDIRLAVALSQADVPVTIEGLRDGKPFKTAVAPIAGEFVPQIYIEPTQGLVLPEPEDGEKNFKLTSPGLSASRAEPPLLPGDEIIELDGSPIDSYAQLQLGLARQRDKTVVLGVRRKGTGKDAPLTEITIAPNHFRTLGLRMAIGQVTAVQPGSPADGKIKPGDTITHIVAPDQKVVGVEFDPLQLPDYLSAQAGKEVRLRIKREVSKGNPVAEEVRLVPDDRPGWIERPSDAVDDCPLSIPAIGVAYHILHHVVAVDDGSPAANAGIHPNDNLQEIRLVPPKDDKGEKSERKEIVLKFGETERDWPTAFWLIQQLREYEVVLVVKGQGSEEVRNITIVPEEDSDWYLPMRGFVMKPLSKTRQAENIGEAVQLGFHRTRDSIIEMWFTIKGLFSRRISPKAIGGPIRIFGTAMFFTKQGIPDLILFLGILSVSLAVLNFLPIPVLDGGHFMFLCWEGIRGKPPSERVVVTATYVGLALVLSLMLFVMYNDIAAFFPKAH
jgi:regulator of sigma E protease